MISPEDLAQLEETVSVLNDASALADIREAESPDHRDWAGLRYESRLAPGWECWALW